MAATWVGDIRHDIWISFAPKGSIRLAFAIREYKSSTTPRTMAAATLHAILFASLLTTSYCGHDELASYRFNVQVGDSYSIYWTFNIETNYIQFAILVQTTGWVGFGLSPNGKCLDLMWLSDGLTMMVQFSSMWVLIIMYLHVVYPSLCIYTLILTKAEMRDTMQLHIVMSCIRFTTGSLCVWSFYTSNNWWRAELVSDQWKRGKWYQHVLMSTVLFWFFRCLKIFKM